MKKEQRVLAWKLLQYYIEMTQKERDMALERGDSKHWIRYLENQCTKAIEAQEAVLKAR